MLVFPSLIPESFGMSGIEAFSTATPVVSFGLGGVSEWLRDGENGLIARDSDVNDLAQKMKRLLMDPELTRQLGQAGHSDVTKKFSASNNIKLLNSVYQKFQPAKAMG